MSKALKQFSTSSTPQSEPIPLSGQVQNSAGGYAFALDLWKRLDRFLILGTDGGTYYTSERKLTVDNAENVLKAIAENGPRVVARVVEISDSGRAPKNDQALFVLALAASKGDLETRQLALNALPLVARIGTHLMQFISYAEQFRGWGRAFDRAIEAWYNNKSADDVAYQVAKYANREGWTQSDILRKAHPKPPTQAHGAVYRWAKDGAIIDGAPDFLHGVNAAKSLWASDGNAKELAALITQYRLPREVIPTSYLTKPEVWEALLPHMGLTAMIRNLATMTRIGLLGPLANANDFVIEQITNGEKLKRSRVHPIQVLSALMTYSSGQSVRGDSTWTPVQQIVDALDAAFYQAFGNVTPIGKPVILGIDVSGSMDMGEIAGVPGLNPRMAAAAMALITANVEKNYHILGFTAEGDSYYNVRTATQSNPDRGVTAIEISPKMRLDKVVQVMQKLRMGATDCSLPVRWAEKHKLHAGAFFVYTDNETWAGPEHPTQSLARYRKLVPEARLASIAFTATDFTIADPKDPGQLDVVGFDGATPELLSAFARGEL